MILKLEKEIILEFINIFDKNCKILDLEFIPKEFKGLDRFEARNKIINKLKEMSLLEKVLPNRMVIPYGERTGIIVEPLLTNQWFVNSKKLCEPIHKLIDNNEIKFHPNLWINTFKHWINNIQPWCISRQIWWGHRIPILGTQNLAIWWLPEMKKKQKLNLKILIKMQLSHTKNLMFWIHGFLGIVAIFNSWLA